MVFSSNEKTMWRNFGRKGTINHEDESDDF